MVVFFDWSIVWFVSIVIWFKKCRKCHNCLLWVKCGSIRNQFTNTEKSMESNIPLQRFLRVLHGKDCDRPWTQSWEVSAPARNRFLSPWRGFYTWFNRLLGKFSSILHSGLVRHSYFKSNCWPDYTTWEKIWAAKNGSQGIYSLAFFPPQE